MLDYQGPLCYEYHLCTRKSARQVDSGKLSYKRSKLIIHYKLFYIYFPLLRVTIDRITAAFKFTYLLSPPVLLSCEFL